MRPIRMIADGPQGKIITDATAIFVGAVIDERQVVDIKDTVLDPEICKNGGWIDLPIECFDFSGALVKRLYYPAFDHQRQGRMINLNRMAMFANRLLRCIESFREGLATPKALAEMVLVYQLGAIRGLGGKNGVVNNNVVASRISHSGRAVVLINGDRAPEIVGIPKFIMRKMGLEDGDLVFVGREPTIWHGSIEVLRARGTNRVAIELHPLVFKQLGADCDGDTVYVYAIPKNAECQEEAAKQILGFTKGFAKWPAFMRMNHPDETVNWDTATEDSQERTKITGFSVTPREILKQGDRLKKLCSVMGKDVADECLKIAKGIDETELRKYVLDQNEALLHMKLWIGPIGSISNRLRVFAGTNAKLLASASYMSERLQQMLLDTKHHIGKKKGYGPTDVIEILNRNGRYNAIGGQYLEDVVDELEKMGMNRKQVWPIMAHLWLVYPLTKAFDALYGKQVMESASSAHMGLFRLQRLQRQISDFFVRPNMKKQLEILARHCKAMGIAFNLQNLMEQYRINAVGLTQICANDFPHMMLMNDRVMQDPTMAFGVAKNIFVRGARDASGVTRVAIEEANNVQS